MKDDKLSSQDVNWKCLKCDCTLIVGPVNLKYTGNEFKTDLPKCPNCHTVFISEELATGKMAEVEQILEDK